MSVCFWLHIGYHFLITNYLGLLIRKGPAYDDLLDEFMEACVAAFGQNVLIQFEDFAYQNAYRLISKYQYMVRTS